MTDLNFVIETVAAKKDQVSSRENVFSRLKIKAALVINDIRVAVTEPKKIDWPAFSAQFEQLFQVNLFTMPSSIKIELILVDGGETTVDFVTIEVPG